MNKIVNVVTDSNGAVNRKKVIASPYEFTIATRAFSHHPLASVIKVKTIDGPSPIETDRIVNSAFVIGQESGEIKKGDLLSVLNLYPIMFTREATRPVEVR
ncbi:MAG: hypothetical protein OIN83_10775 [Candidatus Methanoperedens sp.]|nr:hypothetical protein [Candidatus Methanoperedens sp.]